MRRIRTFAREVSRVALVLLLIGAFLGGCKRSGVDRSLAEARNSSSTSAGRVLPARDLSTDEARGGHTLSRHVGKNDEELAARLETERITAASTYDDRATAEATVGEAIGAESRRIERWLMSSGGHPNLVLDYDANGNVGRTLRRGDRRSRPCSHVAVVLKWLPPRNYYVLTSYPECR